MAIEKICVPSPVGACGHFFIHTLYFVADQATFAPSLEFGAETAKASRHQHAIFSLLVCYRTRTRTSRTLVLPPRMRPRGRQTHGHQQHGRLCGARHSRLPRPCAHVLPGTAPPCDVSAHIRSRSPPRSGHRSLTLAMQSSPPTPLMKNATACGMDHAQAASRRRPAAVAPGALSSCLVVLLDGATRDARPLSSYSWPSRRFTLASRPRVVRRVQMIR
jgi:hypothetical protein